MQLNRLTRAGMAVGTDGYIAPEVIFGEPVDHRSDQYALGVVAYELFTAQHPYPELGLEALLKIRAVTRTPPDPRVLAPALDAPTAELVMRMLQDQSAHRIQSDMELIAAWRDSCAGSLSTPSLPRHVAALSAPAPTQVRPVQAARSPVWPWVLLSVTLTLVAVIALLIWIGSQQPNEPVKAGPLHQSPSVVTLAQNPPKNDDPFDPDDLLYRYRLSKDGEETPSWYLEIFDRRGKNFAARMLGATPEAIKMTGRITSRRIEPADGEDWTTVEMVFKDQQARSIEIEIQYTDESVDGSGFYIEGEVSQHFEINGADAL